MSAFDSPIARCERVRELVLTDETQTECAGEHNCPPGSKCPLCGYFTDTSGIFDCAEAVLLQKQGYLRHAEAHVLSTVLTSLAPGTG